MQVHYDEGVATQDGPNQATAYLITFHAVPHNGRTGLAVAWRVVGDAAEADLYQGDQLIRRGRGRPKLASRKVLLSVRYSPEVV